MSSGADFHATPTASSSAIRLTIQGLGHVPSFKNNKMLARGRIITDPKKQKWMSKCEASLESQLRSIYQTTELAMPMARSLRSWIACVTPRSDSVRHIPILSVTVVKVKKGEEGCEIVIEPRTLYPT